MELSRIKRLAGMTQLNEGSKTPFDSAASAPLFESETAGLAALAKVVENLKSKELKKLVADIGDEDVSSDLRELIKTVMLYVKQLDGELMACKNRSGEYDK